MIGIAYAAPNSPAMRRKTDLDGMIVVDEQVDRAHEIEGDDEQPEERTYPDREKRQHGQHPGCDVAVGGEHREASGQIGADDAWKDEDEPEEAEAVQSSDGAVCRDPVHRPEPRQTVCAEAKQPRDVAEDEMYLEQDFRGHFCLLWAGVQAVSAGFRGIGLGSAASRMYDQLLAIDYSR